MIRITDSMNCSPATSSMRHAPEDLATLLRSKYSTAFEIMPKEMTKSVRMYYDFDGEVADTADAEEFETYTSYLDTLIAGWITP